MKSLNECIVEIENRIEELEKSVVEYEKGVIDNKIVNEICENVLSDENSEYKCCVCEVWNNCEGVYVEGEGFNLCEKYDKSIIEKFVKENKGYILDGMIGLNIEWNYDDGDRIERCLVCYCLMKLK